MQCTVLKTAGKNVRCHLSFHMPMALITCLRLQAGKFYCLRCSHNKEPLLLLKSGSESQYNKPSFNNLYLFVARRWTLSFHDDCQCRVFFCSSHIFTILSSLRAINNAFCR